jgi:hypothetical protein
MELRKYKKTYSTGDLQATDSTVKVKFEACCNQMNNSFIISFAEWTGWVYTVNVELVFVYLKDI